MSGGKAADGCRPDAGGCPGNTGWVQEDWMGPSKNKTGNSWCEYLTWIESFEEEQFNIDR